MHWKNSNLLICAIGEQMAGMNSYFTTNHVKHPSVNYWFLPHKS